MPNVVGNITSLAKTHPKNTVMANHKKGKSANQRAGCKMCKPWKINGNNHNRGETQNTHSEELKKDSMKQQLKETTDE